MKNDCGAEKFWERFDKQRKIEGCSIKDIAEKCEVSYPLLITQRSRNIFPSVVTACKVALMLRTTVEYLTTGKQITVSMSERKHVPETGREVPLDILMALASSSEEDMKLVRRVYRLNDE